jgi:K+-sensing histidine kinase KdpD
MGVYRQERIRSKSMQVVSSWKTWWPQPPFSTGGPMGFVFSLLLVAITTLAIGVATRLVDLGHVGAIYLIAVVISAMRWGLAPALLAAITSVACSAFFFYPPIYSFQVQNWEQFIDLSLFTIVAVVTSQLAVSLNRHIEIADRAIREARARAETDHLRDALIGSVSHELRTPLASILGATSVICSSPAVRAEPHIAALAGVARDEAERLNNDIQNLLDASRISSEGIRPRLEWAEPVDIVNSALERCRTRLAGHRVEVRLSDELPLVQVDAVLIEQALGQILDNAAKYSAPGSRIKVDGSLDREQIVLSVTDEGLGLVPEEEAQLGERFFRGSRHLATIPGSGLGLWIAKAFLRANGGNLEATSAGEGLGLTVSIRLPVPPKALEPVDLSDE